MHHWSTILYNPLPGITKDDLKKIRTLMQMDLDGKISAFDSNDVVSALTDALSQHLYLVKPFIENGIITKFYLTCADYSKYEEILELMNYPWLDPSLACDYVLNSKFSQYWHHYHGKLFTMGQMIDRLYTEHAPAYIKFIVESGDHQYDDRLQFYCVKHQNCQQYLSRLEVNTPSQSTISLAIKSNNIKLINTIWRHTIVCTYEFIQKMATYLCAKVGRTQMMLWLLAANFFGTIQDQLQFIAIDYKNHSVLEALDTMSLVNKAKALNYCSIHHANPKTVELIRQFN